MLINLEEAYDYYNTEKLDVYLEEFRNTLDLFTKLNNENIDFEELKVKTDSINISLSTIEEVKSIDDVDTEGLYEKIKNKLKNIWKNILAFLKKMYDKIASFIRGVFNNKYKEKAEDIKKKWEKEETTLNGTEIFSNLSETAKIYFYQLDKNRVDFLSLFTRLYKYTDDTFYNTDTSAGFLIKFLAELDNYFEYMKKTEEIIDITLDNVDKSDLKAFKIELVEQHRPIAIKFHPLNKIVSITSIDLGLFNNLNPREMRKKIKSFINIDLLKSKLEFNYEEDKIKSNNLYLKHYTNFRKQLEEMSNTASKEINDVTVKAENRIKDANNRIENFNKKINDLTAKLYAKSERHSPEEVTVLMEGIYTAIELLVELEKINIKIVDAMAFNLQKTIDYTSVLIDDAKKIEKFMKR